MIYEFIDRIQADPNKIKLTAVDGEANTYTYEKPGTVKTEGTDINRAALMAIQGLEAVTTVFNPDGSITKTNGLGQKLKTEWLPDGSMVETLTGDKTIKKTTKFTGGKVVITIS